MTIKFFCPQNQRFGGVSVPILPAATDPTAGLAVPTDMPLAIFCDAKRRDIEPDNTSNDSGQK
jgi:hypothetical protein